MAHALNRNATAEQRINLAALQRVDPYITSIITSATQVALYKFVSSEWEKTETEGTLFVYERQGDPQFGFLILNRLSSKNLVEPVTKELDFQLQAPFLLYKTKESHIFGIWFYESKECERVTKTIQDLVAKTEEKMKRREGEAPRGDLAGLLAKAGQGQKTTPQGKSPKSKDKDGGEKLMRLLNNPGSNAAAAPAAARKQPHQQQQQPPSPPAMTTSINGSISANPTTTHADGGNNVAAFFAQAASEQQQHSAFSSPMQPQQPQQQRVLLPPPPQQQPQHHQPQQMLPHHPIPMMHPSLMPMPMGMLMPHQIAAMNAHAAIAMSQAAGIPAAAMFGPRQIMTVPHLSMQQQQLQQKRAEEENELMARLMSNPGTHSVEFLERQQRLESLSPAEDKGNGGNPPMPVSARNAAELEQQLKAAEKAAAADNNRSYASAAAAAGSAGGQPQFGQAAAGRAAGRNWEMEEEGQPKLISPMVFAQTPPTMGGGGRDMGMLPRKTSLVNMFNGGKMNGEVTGRMSDLEITPLNQNQMIQAFQHLLRTDPTFVTKLHQAYVESLNTKLQ